MEKTLVQYKYQNTINTGTGTSSYDSDGSSSDSDFSTEMILKNSNTNIINDIIIKESINCAQVASNIINVLDHEDSLLVKKEGKCSTWGVSRAE